MRYEVSRESIEGNLQEAEDMIRTMNVQSGLILVFQTRTGKERALRYPLIKDPQRDSEDAVRKIAEDGAVKFIAISLYLDEGLENEYFKALNTAAVRYKLQYLDFLSETYDEEGDITLSYRIGLTAMQGLF